MAKRDIHVVPHPDGWAVRREGAGKAGSVHETKREALDVGRERAKRHHVELIPHRGDGRIQNPNSYGNDPYPPRDRRR